MNMNNIDVTICIPVYNVENYVIRAIKSVANQGVKNYEILIIPDKCTDNSINLVKQFITRNPNVNLRLLEEPAENIGISRIRNLAIEKAIGRYIVFLDSDDVMLPNSLAALLNGIESTSADVVIGNYIVVLENGDFVRKSNYSGVTVEGNQSILKFIFNRSNFSKCHFSSWAKIYNLQFLKKNNITCIDDILFDDWVFSLRLFLSVTKIHFIEEQVYEYTAFRKGSTMSLKRSINDPKLIQSWISLLKFYKLEFDRAIKSKTAPIIPFLCDRLCRILDQLKEMNIEQKIEFNRLKVLLRMPINRANLYNYKTLCSYHV